MKAIKNKENFLLINHYYIQTNINNIDAKDEFHLIDRIITIYNITLKYTKNNSIEKLKSE